MGKQALFFFLGFFLLYQASYSSQDFSISRSSFPEGFVFGAGSSAYQVEGAVNEDDRGPSLWDTFSHNYPEKISDHINGDRGVDSYHQFKEDVKILKETGFDAYKFSISWSRVLPRGKLSRGVNEKGIRYYNDLINELLKNGITPYVTLFHFDLPQELQDEYKGFLSSEIVDDFRDFAELCFKRFGDRVKNWITVNEPWTFSILGYGWGTYAPGRCSSWQELNCTGGDSGTEPYLITHHILLAHAAAVKVYKQTYQASQKGIIGIVVVTKWMVPYSNSSLDQSAAQRVLDFCLGWYMEPLVYGDYPSVMRSTIQHRLPKFTKEESEMVKGSFDFIGLNYYTSNYAAYQASTNSHYSYFSDYEADLRTEKNGVPIGEQAASGWLYLCPQGILDLLLYVKKKYNNPPIYITENGADELNNSSLSLEQALVDKYRMKYIHAHLSLILKAIMNGVDVRSYFVWSLLDNFEWNYGYTSRYGIYYVDFKDGFKRYPKQSAKWFRVFLQKQEVFDS